MFPGEEACRRYLEALRRQDGFACPACGSAGEPWRASRGRLVCRACRHEASVTAGTVFDKTRTPLTTWFEAAGRKHHKSLCSCASSTPNSRTTASTHPVIRLARSASKRRSSVRPTRSSLQRGLVAGLQAEQRLVVGRRPLGESVERAPGQAEQGPPMGKRATVPSRLQRYERSYRALTAELASLGFISQGSVVVRYTTCGKAGCRCQADPPRRHGPYHQWSRAVAGKTVSRRLSEREAELYRGWIANRRRLEEIVAEMEQLSAAAAEMLLRQASPPSAPGPGTR